MFAWKRAAGVLVVACAAAGALGCGGDSPPPLKPAAGTEGKAAPPPAKQPKGNTPKA